MSWKELVLHPVPRGLLPTLSTCLFGVGAAGLEESYLPGQTPPPRQPWDTGPSAPLPKQLVIKAWFENPDLSAVRAAAVEVVGDDVEIRWDDVLEQDWENSWKEGFEPIVISPRLVVAPPWDAPEDAVLIEPGQGFGTGQHETTRAILIVLDRLADLPEVQTVWDIGCGSGVLALASAHLGLTAKGIDIDPHAIQDAQHNAQLNGADLTFSTDPIERLSDVADVVLANLFAEAIVPMAGHLVRLTRHHLVLAGILIEKEDMVTQALNPRLGTPRRLVDGEWVCLHYTRTTPP